MNTSESLSRIPMLIIKFKNELRHGEIPFFRGAVISKVPQELTLFHNHIDDGFRYHYPLIQYKRIGGKAAIVCIGEGTDAIGNFFANADFDLQIGNRQEHFVVENVDAKRVLIQTWQSEFHYTLRKWLPLNQENYAQYQALEGVAAKALFLQKILVGNILSLCTGLGIHIEEDISCEIVTLSDITTYKYKGVRMSGFDLEFKTNVSLPDYLGLGKGVSLGYGMIHKNRITNDKQ